MESLACPICKQSYDLQIVVPVIMPCDHTICELCYIGLYQPQEDTMICPLDNQQFNLQQKTPYNRSIIDILKQRASESIVNQGNERLMCANHKGEALMLYCSRHNEFLCSECSYQHRDHQHLLEIVEEQDLLQYFAQLKAKLGEKLEFIRTQYSSLDNVVSSNLSNSSVQNLNEQMNLAVRSLTEPFVSEIRYVKFKHINDDEEQAQIVLTPIGNNQVSELAIDSKIIFSEEDRNLLKQWFSHLIIRKCSKIFDIAMDNSKLENFQAKCHNAGPLLCILRSTNGFVFGSFTTKSLTIKDVNDLYQNDQDSFLFSINRQQKLVQKNKTKFSFCHSSKVLLMFGIHDLRIFARCELHKKNSSNVGTIYFPENKMDMKKDSEEALTYLAGEHEFKIERLEVYSIQYELAK